MTKQQRKRWEQFARAMAARGFRESTPARAARRIEYLERFFQGVTEREWRAWHSWDQPPREEVMFLCDYFTEFQQEIPGYWGFGDRDPDRWRWHFADELHCCLRAGIDMVAEPSVGVIGFTVSDLKAMFRGRLPAWVRQAFNQDPVEAADSDGVWL